MATQLEKARGLLLKHLEKKGRGEASRLACVIGCDVTLPKKWALGERTPDADSGYREKLETEVGIPAAWWKKLKVVKSAA